MPGSILQRRTTMRAHPVVTGGVQQLGGRDRLHSDCAADPESSCCVERARHRRDLLSRHLRSIVGYSAYVYALGKLPVSIFSIYPYVNAVVAVGLGWLFYREAFGLREMAAMLIIFAGVAIVKWQSGKATAKAAVAPSD